MAKQQWMGICAGIVAGFMAATPVRAQPAALLSVAEGGLSLIRGASLYSTSPGIRIHEGDILRTQPGALAVVELPDGSLLGLGPDTRAMVLALRPVEVAVLSGWIKFAQKGSPQAVPFRL